MAIRVVYQPDLQAASQVGVDIGMGELRTQAQQLAQQEALRTAELDERAREFDMSAAMRTRSEYLRGQQYQSQIAARQQAAAQQAAVHAADQDASLQRMYLAQQFGQDDMQMQDELLYGRQHAMSLEEQANSAFKELRKLKFDPTGQKLFTDFEAQLRQIQSAPLRAEQRAEVLGELMADMQQADLSQYEQKPPTGYDDMQGWVPLQGQQLVPGQPPPPGYYYGQTGMRNDMPEYGTRYIPDPANPTDYRPVDPNHPELGGTIADPTTGERTFVPPPKPAAAPKVVNEQEQIGEYVDSMAKAATIFKSLHTFDDDGNATMIATPEKVMEFYDKLIEGYKKPRADGESHRDLGAPRADIPPEMGGVTSDAAESPDGMINQDELGPGERISEAADGTRAVIDANGNVVRIL